MPMQLIKYRPVFLGILFCLLGGFAVQGQQVLQKRLSINVNQQRLDNVLEILSNKGDFYFSYNSNIVRKDSLVSLNVSDKTVREILSQLFNNTYEFRESGNYVIIRKAPIRMTMVVKKGVLEEKIYAVSGFVYDEHTGAAISEASIYEKKILASAMTDQEGFFRIRLKSSSKSSKAALTVSKQFYEDTTVEIQPRVEQQVTITMVPIEFQTGNIVVAPGDFLIPDTTMSAADSALVPGTPLRTDTIKVQQAGVGRVFLSERQKKQSLNLKNFFTGRPFQFSLVPGLSTQGKLSSQVVNHFSLNILGGYTAGIRGVELGGLFNIVKQDVRYVQVGGLFNSVGGKVTGVQLAGINNFIQDDVGALQAAGVNNFVKGKMSGLQLAGVYNHVTDSVKGVLVSGVGNFSKKNVTGVQLAGVINISNREIRGAQLSGVINYTKRLKGVQVGLINIVDSSEGYSIGLINIVLKGYHKLGVSASEVQNLTISFKTGNSKLYSMLIAGLHAGDSNKLYSFGYGLGSELNINKSKTLSLNPELSSQYLYLGSWDYTNILNRFQLNLNVKLGKYVSLFAGPAYSLYLTDQDVRVSGYRFPASAKGIGVTSFSNRFKGWFGWNAGINFF